MNTTIESKRRTVVKSLLWRIIGIVWTWVGAYFILIFIPEKYKTAAVIATLIVVYHHSTRMVMYYFYERIWLAVSWGRGETVPLLDANKKALWATSLILTVALIFFLLFVVTPLIKS